MFNPYQNNDQTRTLVDDVMTLPESLAIISLGLVEWILKCVPHSEFQYHEGCKRWVLESVNFVSMSVHPNARHLTFTLYGRPERYPFKSPELLLKPDQASYSRCDFENPLQLPWLVRYIDHADELKARKDHGPFWKLLRGK